MPQSLLEPLPASWVTVVTEAFAGWHRLADTVEDVVVDETLIGWGDGLRFSRNELRSGKHVVEHSANREPL